MKCKSGLDIATRFSTKIVAVINAPDHTFTMRIDKNIRLRELF